MANPDEALPPFNRRRHDRELWVGLFVLLGAGAGLLLAFVLTEPAMLRGRAIVKTFVDDAGGLRKGDPVQMRGVVIGRVAGFAIDTARNKVEVTLEVERGSYRIPRDSRAEIKSRSLYGEMAAVILPGRSRQDLRSGDVIRGQLVRDLFSGGSEVADKAEDVVTRMQKLLADETLTNVQSSTAELQQLLQQLHAIADEQRSELRTITRSLRRSALAVDRATSGPELESAIRRTDALIAQLQTIGRSLDRSSRSLETVLGRVERGEGSLGKLLKDEDFYINLNQAVRNASLLAADVRAHPGRYVKVSLF